MRDVLLALSVGAMFLYGFYIMKKVDEFIEEIQKSRREHKFAFCYAGELEPERIRHNADKILEILRTQHVNEQTGEVLPVPCSIGIVMSQGDTLDYTQLIRKADLAMYQAKENGKNTFVLNVD